MILYSLNPTLVNIAAHVDRVLPAYRLALLVVGTLHLLVSLLVALRQRVRNLRVLPLYAASENLSAAVLLD